MRIYLLQKPFAWLITFSIIVGCSSIAPFSQRAYEQATSLKVEAMAVMDKATETYSSQQQAVDALKLNVEKAYEYAKGRPQNEVTTKQWAIIIKKIPLVTHWEAS